MKLYNTFTMSIAMAFLVLTSASCSNMTKEQGMTTLYEKVKGGGGGSSGTLFDNLTPNDIDTKMTGVTATSIQLSNLKAGSVFIFKGTSSVPGFYWGKVLVTKVVEGEKFEFQFVLYNQNKSVVATDDDEGLASGGSENLGKVKVVGPTTLDATITIRMDSYGDVRVYAAATRANILLLN